MQSASSWIHHYSTAIWSIGTMIGGVVLGWATSVFQRRRKILDYQVLVNSPLIDSAARSASTKLRLMWQDHQLEQPRIVTVRIKNTGNQGVRDDDYDEGIRLSLPGAEVYEVSIDRSSKSRPYTTDDAYVKDSSPEPGTILMTPRLMNPGDWFDITAIVDGDTEPSVRTRFADQSRKMREPHSNIVTDLRG